MCLYVIKLNLIEEEEEEHRAPYVNIMWYKIGEVKDSEYKVQCLVHFVFPLFYHGYFSSLSSNFRILDGNNFQKFKVNNFLRIKLIILFLWQDYFYGEYSKRRSVY